MSPALGVLNPALHWSTLAAWTRLLRRHGDLTWELSRREVTDRYAGQVFGPLWAVGHPLLLMSVYVLVFTYVFRGNAGDSPDMPFSYPAYLLSGLIPWLSFQEGMLKATSSIVDSANLVKQVVFPVELLPIRGVLACLFTELVALAFLVGFMIVRHHALPATYALLPLLVVLQALAMSGLAYALAVIGTYFRDLKDFLQVFFTIGIYLLPILFAPSWVPRPVRPLLYLNPLSYVVWCFQDVCYFGRIAHPWAWVVTTIGSVVLFTVGYRLFQRIKPLFGNVL